MAITGEIAEILDDIRFLVDDPSLRARYTDVRLLPKLKAGFRAVLRDITLISSQAPISRYSFDTVARQAVYPLPRYAEILQIAKVSDITGLNDWSIRPNSFWSPIGAGYILEGARQIRFVPTPQTGGDTLTIAFIPSGDGEFYRAECKASDSTTTTVKLSTSPLFGRFPTDPLAFVGHFIRIFDTDGGTEFPEETRQVTNYVASTRTVTVTPAFLTDASAFEGNLSVEITPDLLYSHKQLIALYVARFISGVEKRRAGYNSLNTLYNDEKRSIMLLAANAEGRIGQRFQDDTIDNSDYWVGS